MIDKVTQSSLLLEISTNDVACLDFDARAIDAARLMAEQCISSVVITDSEGRPAGIVTERNILQAMQTGRRTETPLNDIMSSPLVSVPSTITVQDAYQLCLQRNIRHLVIVDKDGELAGVVSETDFRRHLNLTALTGRRKIASVARRSALTLSPSDSLSQALSLMLAQHKSCVVVLEEKKPVGIVTERDVVHFYSSHTAVGDVTLGEVMAKPVLTISGNAPTSESAELMLAHKVRHLVVVDEAGCMAGLLSEQDLTRIMAGGQMYERGGLEESFLRTLVNTLPNLIWLKDKDGVYLACNSRFERLYGAKEQDIIGKTDYVFVDKALADFFREHDRMAMQAGEPTLNEEWLTYADDGHRELVETIKTPMQGRNGELIGVLGIARDITARKQLEENLERSERKLHDIYDSVGDCIEIISADGRILDMNRIGYERLGYTREEMIGRRLSEFAAPEFSGQMTEIIAQIRRDGHATFESSRLHRDGTRMPLEVRSRLIRLDGEEVFLGISRDITERKRTEDALRFIAQRNAAENPESILTGIVQYLGKVLGVDYVIIDRLADEPDEAETVALYVKGAIAPNMRYALKDTPCDNVIGKEMCCYGKDVQALFPQDKLLTQMGAESYAGMPLWDSAGRPIGLIAVLDSKPFVNEAVITGMLQLMAARAASELERARSEQTLRVREQDLRQVLEFTEDVINAIPDLLFELDRDGRYLNIWAHDPGLLAAQKEVLLGHTVHEILPPATADIVMKAVAEAIEKGSSSGQIIQIDLPQGQRWFELSAAVKHAAQASAGSVLMLSRDITDRMKTEAALHDSHAKLSGLFTLSPMGIALTDMQGRYVEFNDAFRDICGYTRDELNALDYWALTPKEYAEQEAAQLESLNSKGYYGPYEKEYIHKDGHRIPLRLNGVLIHGSDSQPYIWSIVENISARKRAEKELREKEERLALATLHNGVGIWDWNLVTQQMIWDDSMYALYRIRREDFIGTEEAWRKSLHPDDLGRVYYEVENAIADIRPFDSEFRVIRPDGEVRHIKAMAKVFRDENGKPVRMLGTNMDITERKRLERQVLESEELFRAVFTQAPSAVELIDPDTLRFIEANPAACSMLGYTREEYLQLRLTDTQAETMDEATLRDSIRHIEKLGGLTFENQHRRKNGEIMLVEINARMLDLSGRRLLVGVWRDITERKRADETIRESENKYRTLFETAGDGIFLQNANGFIDCNEKGAAMYGLTREQVIGMSPILMAAERQPNGRLSAEVAGEVIAAAMGGQPCQFEWQALRADGSTLDVEINVSRIEYKGEACLQAVVRDITERKRGEESLRITASVFETTQEAIVITDANNIITDVNPAFTRITGYSRDEVLGRNPKFLSSGRHDRQFYSEMWQTIVGEKSWRGEIWNRRKTGETYAELLSISAICGSDGKVQRHVGVFSDISYMKEYEAELSRVAHYDALTGVLNRVLLADRMKQAIAQTARERDMMAVCYLDLDGFKPINDSLGHDAGDQVLIEIARRIGHTIRGGDTVARLGGDEFVVLLLGLQRGEECMATLERLLDAIRQPMLIKGKLLVLGASIGVSIYPLDNEDSDTLLRHADQAMYVSKQSGKNRYHIYDPALDQRARDHYEFIGSIRAGIAQNQFELHYQPKIKLKTRELAGVEALIRWRHAERGLLPPAEFLPAIEGSELGIEIGEWVISEALDQLERWHLAGLDTEISVNISASHLESPSFMESLQRHLALHPGVEPRQLQIEVLETAALKDIAVVHDLIEACRRLGVRFALDDFGTGYSSLSYLSSLPVDILKIDQSFVRDMLEDAGDRTIVQGVIALARAFGRETVAEGIESDAHLSVLLEMGCETGQGYGIARPMPVAALGAWLKERHALP